jgi:hypothetical protein
MSKKKVTPLCHDYELTHDLFSSLKMRNCRDDMETLANPMVAATAPMELGLGDCISGALWLLSYVQTKKPLDTQPRQASGAV